jgi:hypothetical protein
MGVNKGNVMNGSFQKGAATMRLQENVRLACRVPLTENRSGFGAPAVEPIPDTSKKTTSTPVEKPVTPAQPPTAPAR